jgi:hypothetical protein
MKRNLVLWLGAAMLLFWIAGSAHAQITTYTEETAYLNALATSGYGTFEEGFEDNATWGSVRFPNAAPSVTSMGIVWTSNHPNAVTQPSHITTDSGPARTGLWGFFSSPHGNPGVTDLLGFIEDGFIGTRQPGAGTLYGVGGWFTGTFGGQIILILDGDELNPISLGPLTSTHQFYGVIDTTGFSKFEVRETEGTREDQKFVFSDDFTFGMQPSPGNNPPVANAGPDQTVLMGDAVTLDGSASSDVDGDPLTFSWSFSSVPAGSTAALDTADPVHPTFLVDVAGTYVVQLIVNDNNADSAPDTVDITTGNSPPVANAGPPQGAGGCFVATAGYGVKPPKTFALIFLLSIIAAPLMVGSRRRKF